MNVLGFSSERNLTANAIKNAARRRALITHPNKGGTAAKFREVRNARDRLLNHIASGGSASRQAPRRQRSRSPNMAPPRADPSRYVFHPTRRLTNVQKQIARNIMKLIVPQYSYQYKRWIYPMAWLGRLRHIGRGYGLTNNNYNAKLNAFNNFKNIFEPALHYRRKVPSELRHQYNSGPLYEIYNANKFNAIMRAYGI
jgi:curved DNA-binding protein CbpA